MFNPMRIAARLLTGSTYAVLGPDAVRAPGARVDQAATTLAALRKIVPLPDDEVVVRGKRGGAGAGRDPARRRRSPAVLGDGLVGSLVPTTIAGHAFWTIEDPTARKLQRTQFHKNMAMIGGLLFAGLDTPRRGARVDPATARSPRCGRRDR
jgi:hypothetical protein